MRSPLVDEEGFKRACREIGEAIVRYRHQLVVGSDSPWTADLYSVEGAVRYLKSERRSGHWIECIGPRSESGLYDEQRDDLPAAFKVRKVADTWSDARPLQIKAADAVIVIAGNRLSFQGGLIAAVEEAAGAGGILRWCGS